MKNIAILLVLFSFTLKAQDSIKPKFEKEGELTKAMFYHDNGEVAQTGYFKDNKRHGNWTSYHPSGKNLLWNLPIRSENRAMVFGMKTI